MKKIAVGASSFGGGGPAAAELLESAGYTIVPNPHGRKLTQEETIEHLAGAVGLLAGLEPLNEAVFAACPNLKAVARIGIGMDNVDAEAAARHGVKVSNTPDGPTYAVAEMCLAALLAIGRQLPAADRDMHAGVWQKRMGFSLRGLTVLLVGYGRIARRFEAMLDPFGAQMLRFDPQYPELAGGQELTTLFAKADVVSLHAGGNGEILGRAELAAMKPGAVLLNSARGALVNEAALVEFLQNGHISAYWADVFTEEPYHGPLAGCENALLTPHIATYTGLCRREMELEAAKNLLEDLA